MFLSTLYKLSSATFLYITLSVAVTAQTNGQSADVDVIGSDSEVSIQQIDGSHYTYLNINGNSNITEVLQVTQTYSKHYLEAYVSGSSNSLILQQRETGKNAYVSVDGDDNTIVLNQNGLGNHYLNMSLVGNNHTASILQDGSGNHSATVQLENGGGPWNFVLNQTGSTSKIYNLLYETGDVSTVSGVCNLVAGCNLTVNQ